jgi:hypothetical protein
MLIVVRILFKRTTDIVDRYVEKDLKLIEKGIKKDVVRAMRYYENKDNKL